MPSRIALSLPLLLAVALGCEEAPKTSSSATTSALASSATGKASAAPQAPGRPQKALTVTVDDKPVEIVTALASQEEGKIKIEFSSAPLTCADLAKNGRMMADGEVTFTTWLKPVLEKDGTTATYLDLTWFSGMSAQVNKPAKVSGDGADGQPTAAELDFETTSAGENKRKLVVKGKAEALGCPATKRPGAEKQPELPPPTDLMLEVAGKKMPVRSAWLEEEDDGDRRLVLYTGGEDCKGNGRSSEVKLVVTFKKGKPWQLTLMGDLIPQQMIDQTFDEKKVTVKLPAKAPGAAQLAIDAAVMGYSLKVNGKIDAQACTK